MRQKAVSLFLCYLLLYTCSGVEAGKREDSEDSGSGFWGQLAYMAVGGGATGGNTLMAKIGAFLGYTVHKHLKNEKSKEEDE
uniref:Interferon alpha inducible protein 6 n=1 Tax=Molossus molossus TaxID=27622 RepID=A0A7J8F9C6_MOLMO|nr:interferon alpha inducible protein 6 [Molossus molossus]